MKARQIKKLIEKRWGEKIQKAEEKEKDKERNPTKEKRTKTKT